MILLTLNRIIKVGDYKQTSIKIATPLLKKLTTLLNLNYMHFGMGLDRQTSVSKQSNKFNQVNNKRCEKKYFHFSDLE